MNYLNYVIHLLLNSKYKPLVNILIYIIIILLYNLSNNDVCYVDCMKRSHPTETDTDTINKLQEEIARLNALRATENIEQETAIKVLEDNQRYLIGKNRALQAHLLEARQTIETLTNDNIDLRSRVVAQRQYSEGLRRSLEISEKLNEDLSLEILNLEKK